MIAARPRPRETEAAPDDAQALMRLISESAAAAAPRQVLALRLSVLAEGRARPHHLRLARAALDPLGAADRAKLFQLPNHDIVVVWRGDAADAVQASRRAVSHLFADDDLDHDALIELHALPADARALMALIERSLAGTSIAPPPPPPAAPPLEARHLAALESLLARADLTRFARRRPVCRLGSDDRLTLAWEKRFLCAEELAASVLPDRAMRADPWLFRRLTRMLDRRMLALLAAPQELRAAGPFSLNLNVASILSPEFLRFDAALPGSLRGEVVLALLPADILADPAAFLFARDFARVRGYRTLLRRVTAELVDVFSAEATGVDYIQWRWSPELSRRAGRAGGTEPGQLVLARADDAEAIAWGTSHGIVLMQGSVVQPAG